ncbi:hypothetical protein ACS0PU_007559 [Formica fusca]
MYNIKKEIPERVADMYGNFDNCRPCMPSIKSLLWPLIMQYPLLHLIITCNVAESSHARHLFSQDTLEGSQAWRTFLELFARTCFMSCIPRSPHAVFPQPTTDMLRIMQDVFFESHS